MTTGDGQRTNGRVWTDDELAAELEAAWGVSVRTPDPADDTAHAPLEAAVVEFSSEAVTFEEPEPAVGYTHSGHWPVSGVNQVVAGNLPVEAAPLPTEDHSTAFAGEAADEVVADAAEHLSGMPSGGLRKAADAGLHPMAFEPAPAQDYEPSVAVPLLDDFGSQSGADALWPVYAHDDAAPELEAAERDEALALAFESEPVDEPAPAVIAEWYAEAYADDTIVESDVADDATSAPVQDVVEHDVADGLGDALPTLGEDDALVDDSAAALPEEEWFEESSFAPAGESFEEADYAQAGDWYVEAPLEGVELDAKPVEESVMEPTEAPIHDAGLLELPFAASEEAARGMAVAASAELVPAASLDAQDAEAQPLEAAYGDEGGHLGSGDVPSAALDETQEYQVTQDAWLTETPDVDVVGADAVEFVDPDYVEADPVEGYEVVEDAPLVDEPVVVDYVEAAPVADQVPVFETYEVVEDIHVEAAPVIGEPVDLEYADAEAASELAPEESDSDDDLDAYLAELERQYGGETSGAPLQEMVPDADLAAYPAPAFEVVEMAPALDEPAFDEPFAVDQVEVAPAMEQVPVLETYEVAEDTPLVDAPVAVDYAEDAPLVDEPVAADHVEVAPVTEQVPVFDTYEVVSEPVAPYYAEGTPVLEEPVDAWPGHEPADHLEATQESSEVTPVGHHEGPGGTESAAVVFQVGADGATEVATVDAAVSESPAEAYVPVAESYDTAEHAAALFNLDDPSLKPRFAVAPRMTKLAAVTMWLTGVIWMLVAAAGLSVTLAGAGASTLAALPIEVPAEAAYGLVAFATLEAILLFLCASGISRGVRGWWRMSFLVWLPMLPVLPLALLCLPGLLARSTREWVL